MTPQEIEDFLNETDEPVLKANGFDEAIIGLSDSWSGNSRPIRLVYSRAKCIEILISQGLSAEEAEEHFEFNTAGAYMGEHTPIFVM